MADKTLYDMTQEEALEYLRGLEGIQNIGTIKQTGGTNEYDPIFYTDASGKEIRSADDGYSRPLTPLFDPNYAGGVYGQYEGIYDKEGNLKDVKFRKGERDEGFYFRNLDVIGPLAVFGAMGAGAGLFGGAGGGISPGTMAGLETGLAGGAGASGAGISAGTMAGLEAGLPALEGAGISSGTMAGLEAGLPALEGAGISSGTMAGLEAGLAEGAGAGISEGTMAGLEAGLAEAGGAVGPSSGLTELAKSLGVNNVYDALKLGLLGAGALDLLGGNKGSGGTGGGVTNLITPYTLNREVNPQAQPLTSKDAYAYLQGKASPTTGKAVSTGQQNWFNDKFTAQDTVNPTTGERFVRDPASGQMIPLKNIQDAQAQVDANKTDTATGADGGIVMLARGGYADLLDGSTLGGYSDGGRLLRGPGDGVSDSIPATIGGKQPARLADGEFVVPARIVSELGNGSTEAGARKLYAMMDRIQRGRRKTVGKNAVAKDSKADKHLPA